MTILQPTTNEFEALLQSEAVVVVDFFATWCGPCKMIAPVLAQLAEAYAGKATVVKIDIDAQPDLAARYSVMSVPTLLFFKGGTVAEQVIGARPYAFLAGKLDPLLS